jgi:urea carboxylase/allophanate hydrolase
VGGTAGLTAKPWKFRTFDRITFYPVTEAELDSATDDMVRVEESETLDLDEYEAWLERESDSINKITQARQEAFSSAPYLQELLEPAPDMPNDGHGRVAIDGEVLPPGEAVRALVPGRCFRVAVKEGDEVRVGDALAWVESNKMELKIASPVEGRGALVRRAAGDLVDANEVMFVITMK